MQREDQHRQDSGKCHKANRRSSKLKRPKSSAPEVDVADMVRSTTSMFLVPPAEAVVPPREAFPAAAVHKPLRPLPAEDGTEEEGDVKRTATGDTPLPKRDSSPSEEQFAAHRPPGQKSKKKQRRHRRRESSKAFPHEATSTSSTEKPIEKPSKKIPLKEAPLAMPLLAEKTEIQASEKTLLEEAPVAVPFLAENTEIQASEKIPLEESPLASQTSLESVASAGLQSSAALQLGPQHEVGGAKADRTSGALSRQPGVEYLQGTGSPRHQRRHVREPQGSGQKESPKTSTPGRHSLAGRLRLRTPSTGSRPSPPRHKTATPDLRRLLGSLDLTTPEKRDRKSDAQPEISTEEDTPCPFTVPPDVGPGFLLEPSVKTLTSLVTPEPRRCRLTRTRSLPNLELQNAAPEFLRNRLVLQTDDSVYLPFILRKEYVIRTKLRVQFRLLKRPGRARSKSVGDSTTVTFMEGMSCKTSGDSSDELDESEWRLDEVCDFFGLCYFRCKCCKKRQAGRAEDGR